MTTESSRRRAGSRSRPLDEEAAQPVPDPPARLKPPNVVELTAGELLHRVHDRQFDGGAFNPCRGGPTRFAPIRDAHDRCIPSLYAADTVEAAIYETILHDVPLRATRKSLPHGELQDRRHSTLMVRRLLRLASLRAPDLLKWGLRRETLIASLPTQYRRTALWAKAVHDQFDGIDGLVWTSNLCDPDSALLLFGDRVAATDLLVTGVREGSDGSFLQNVRKAAQRSNILIAL